MKTVKVRIDEVIDEQPDVSYLEQTPKELESITAAVANRRRLIAFRNDEWHMVGIRLAADVTLKSEEHVSGFTITSPGLWGVESDSGAEYMKSIAEDEKVYLRDDLVALGFSEDEVDRAIDAVVS